jgi:hypothetical protein
MDIQSHSGVGGFGARGGIVGRAAGGATSLASLIEKLN